MSCPIIWNTLLRRASSGQIRSRVIPVPGRIYTKNNGRCLSTSPTKPVNDPDPFGLDEMGDEPLNSIVTGIYSSRIPCSDSTTGGITPQNPRERYKNWVEEAERRRHEAKLNPTNEMIHSAAFGSIRFDRENCSLREDDEEDYQEPIRNKNKIEVLNETSQYELNEGRRNTQDSAGSSPALDSDSSKPNATTSTNNTVPKPSVLKPTPSVYKLQSLNELTREEVLLMLKRHVVFQNDFLFAIDKPYGLPMHTPSKECRHTVLDFLDELTKYSKSHETLYPLHRLDKDTTGVLLFGKNKIVATIIKEKFAARQIHKKYLVITKNSPQIRRGTIDIPISEGQIGGNGAYRSVLKPDLRGYKIFNSQGNAKSAITHFRVISSGDHCSFMEVWPETGLKHQVRLHLGMGLGCPILGDHKYSHREKLAPQRLSSDVLNSLNIRQSKVRELPLHLHCSVVEFTMPETFSKSLEPVFVHCRPPRHFMHSLRRLGLK